MTTEELKALPDGTRVTFPGVIDCYPHFMFRGPLHGTITHRDGWNLYVKLDDHKPELDEWGNEVEVTLYEDGLPYEMEVAP